VVDIRRNADRSLTTLAVELSTMPPVAAPPSPAPTKKLPAASMNIRIISARIYALGIVVLSAWVLHGFVQGLLAASVVNRELAALCPVRGSSAKATIGRRC
jgi:hypothetical protein